MLLSDVFDAIYHDDDFLAPREEALGALVVVDGVEDVAQQHG